MDTKDRDVDVNYHDNEQSALNILLGTWAEHAVRAIASIDPDKSVNTMLRLDEDGERWRLRCISQEKDITTLQTALAKAQGEIFMLRQRLEAQVTVSQAQ